ncbi:Uncharacterised protein [Mycobacteroides abscessus subsp. abscessus]|nr:Uncharacterised protein [Mycobacteroides abscessus subsp. abscessus]SHU33777.1 Uncharacterised protein [Mycobacteroides abscessus subsp. abscessus]SIL01764.1 Uncharacterised protein [Mycobacteroides abscessus subsp. abscessus]SKT80899.1 Uncharacterised protein [Mycobacteroides abscessus subsp. abscessus]
MAMNGVLTGTCRIGKPSSSPAARIPGGTSLKVVPVSNASAATFLPDSLAAYSYCSAWLNPTVSPVVITSSPPNRYGVGSFSSIACAHLMALAAPASPADSTSPRSAR